MAYNYYNGYQQPYRPDYQPYMTTGFQSGNALPQNMQNAQGNFISVHNEDEARNYPVAPNTSVTFIDENAPFCYVKTMGINQFDRPRFDRYRLVKEDEPQAESKPNGDKYATKEELSAVIDELTKIKSQIKDKVNKNEQSADTTDHTASNA